MPPNFDGDEQLTGSVGRFLSIFTACIQSGFAYTGVEIAAVTAAEAKYPKRDFPFAAKCTWIIAISLYFFSVVFVSLCVPWNDPGILNPSADFNGNISPFIIAMREAGIAVLPSITNAGFLFSAWTCANTQLYASSRMLFGMCQGMTRESNPWIWPLGRTRKKNGAPVMAILVSCIFTPLSYLLCAKTGGQNLINILSGMSTVGELLVWAAQCAAFIRFYFGYVLCIFIIFCMNAGSYQIWRSVIWSR